MRLQDFTDKHAHLAHQQRPASRIHLVQTADADLNLEMRLAIRVEGMVVAVLIRAGVAPMMLTAWFARDANGVVQIHPRSAAETSKGPAWLTSETVICILCH